MMKLKSTAIAALVLLSGAAAQAQSDAKVYIVQLKEEPTTTYQGTTAGYAATQAVAGTAFNGRSPAALAYGGYLRDKQIQVLSTVSTTAPISQLDTVVNGFTAMLTSAQAQALSLNANVALVAEDQIVNPVTITTPIFLGLTAANGIWSQTDANSLKVKGEGMVHGNVDLGIWPENPAYADRVDGTGAPTFSGGTLAYGPPPATFTGSCVAGDAFDPATACNNKLIGAKSYSANLMAGKSFHWTSFNSPRDDLGGATGHGGHGDHTASTVAGNSLVPAVVNGITMGNASGMAPRARIASYKVCFTYVNAAATDGTGSQNACSSADSLLAINDAVKDGVNSINYSISGATGTTNDIVEQAFYRAALAGIFVAAAAGNDGPGNTANHPSPWLTTVAAATHDRLMAGDVNLGNGAKYSGASLNVNALPSASLVRAEDVGLGGGAANLCFSAASAASAAGQVLLDPAKVAGKIVICTRGTNARVDKSLAVLNAGGVGMVEVDNGAGLVSEVHSVPTVHVSAADGALIKSYAVSAGAGATASETAFYAGKQPAPTIASFSGRGPNLADSNVLKPDVAAPGVGVIAAVTPALTQAQRTQMTSATLSPVPNAWASYDGTSMATPHVTGIALLLKQAHPTWSPAAIKSALMTSAMDTLDDGLTGMQNGKLPWSQGAGFIQPNKAMDPGLVYDMGKADFVKYQCLTQKSLVSASDCSTYGTLDQTYNLNLPSITVGTMVGPTVVTRSVTNVGTAAATYTSTASLPGMGSVAVSPASLTLNPGETKSFTVTMTPGASTPQFTWMYGSLSWTDGTHVVRSPMLAYKGSSISAPAAAAPATVLSGSRTFTVRTGYAGKMTVAKGIQDVTLGPVTTLVANTALDVGVACKSGVPNAALAQYSFTIPANTIVARFALRNADVSSTGDDNDLAVVAPDGTTTISGSGTSHETVEILRPAAGDYRVCVAAYAGTAPMTHKLSSWIVKSGDTAGGTFNAAVATTVYAGGSSTAGISWSGLQTSHRYVGGAMFLDASATPAAATSLTIDTTPNTPSETVTPASDSKKGVAQVAPQ
ncbi:S8 family serine peptidase [Pelomonas sp. KK5]|uniref:S8 family serine peptidase n=1 Tax=Pelomonas sp. KK5 TaxID=1855730 RepID=UPI00097C2415|nr:S8 family serine peptidase [Pelomonas sp. KK5]